MYNVCVFFFLLMFSVFHIHNSYICRCHSATQSLASSNDTVCRSSSTYVLSYARHSIISFNDCDTSKRFTRLRFVCLSFYSLSTLSHTQSHILHSLSKLCVHCTCVSVSYFVVALAKIQLPPTPRNNDLRLSTRFRTTTTLSRSLSPPRYLSL